MSFILKKVELNNIRIHEHFIFEPMETGVTAISGDNGAGKSTIVDSLAWCLFGIRVNNIKNKHFIREGVNPRTSPVNVKVTLLSGGIEYVVERKLIHESGSAECNVWGKIDGEEELTHIAGPAVSHVESFIRQTLNMDDKGFLTSVLIQQKQVDQIVSASPRERGEVIEKLTGIASITHAISMTNEENRTLSKAALLLQAGNLDEAEDLVNTQESLCEDLTESVKVIKVEYDNELKLFNLAKETLAQDKIKLTKSLALQSQIDTLSSRNSLLKEQSDDDLAYIEKYKKEFGTIAIVDLAQLKTERTKLRSNSRELRDMCNKLESQINIHSKLILDSVDLTEDEYIKMKADKESELSSINDELDESVSRRHEIVAEYKQLDLSLDDLACEDTTCPTCRGEIKDPKQLINDINENVKQLKADAKTFKTRIDEIQVNKVNCEQSLHNLTKEWRKILASNEAKVNKDKLEEEYKEIHAQLTIADEDLAMFEKDYDNHVKTQANKSALDSAKVRSLSAVEQIGKNNVKISQLKDELSRIDSITQAAFDTKERQVNRLMVSVTNLSSRGKETLAKMNLAKERLGDYKENLVRVQETLDKHNEIAERIKVLTSTATLLAEFKKSRIEYSIPTLEFYASDILSKFTGGKFIKLSLDEKFNTTVTTSDEVVRPIAQLSGGELSSAAIALRLGIALLLNSSEQSALIFDEVLVSMDEDRARQIMETISSITNCQVIFIAHNTDINSIADKVVEVK